ncbi:hypothetical protein TgHK011_005643 [Trichoderma gracile]|nr:hypothetical protein TgHK011_005643 [Trichoderma gracile]
MCSLSYSLRLASYSIHTTIPYQTLTCTALLALHRHQTGAYTASGGVSNSPMSEPRSLERWRLGRSLEPGFWQPWQLALSLCPPASHAMPLGAPRSAGRQIHANHQLSVVPDPPHHPRSCYCSGQGAALVSVASGSGTWPAGDGAAARVRCISGGALGLNWNLDPQRSDKVATAAVRFPRLRAAFPCRCAHQLQMSATTPFGCECAAS